MGGSELGWRCIAGRDQEEMGAETLVPRAVSYWLRVLTGAKEGGFPVAPKAVRKQGPSSGDLLPGPLGPPWGGSEPE